MDQRDDITWVTLELTSLGEIKVEEGTLEKILRKELGVDGDSEYSVFIPVSQYNQNGRKVTLHLMEGYAFVQSGLLEQLYFDLEKSPYIEQVFSSNPNNGLRVIQTISNEYIQEMRGNLRGMANEGLKIGNTVKILKGAYRLLEGEVLGFDGDAAFVGIYLRSLSAVVTLPKVYLDLLEGGVCE